MGGWIGASTTAEDGFSLNPKNWGKDWWQGAIVGGILGATAGSFVASAVGATGITVGNAGLVATKGWGITSTALQTGSLNVSLSAIQGQGLDGMWKSGVVGLASGAWTATGGMGLVNKGLFGKLAYQNVGLAGRSIGHNWSAGEDLFSKVTVGLGPVNLTLGKNQKLLQWQNNLGNIIFNTVGLANLTTGGKMSFDWKNLTPSYYGGLLDKAPGAMGAHTILTNKTDRELFHDHELHHIWQSRSLGDMFLPVYAMQGLSAYLYTKDFSDFIYELNFFETIAYGSYWW